MYKFTKDFGKHKRGDEVCFAPIESVDFEIAILLHLGILVKVEEGKWKPKEGDEYWFFDHEGIVYHEPWANDSVDKERLAFGNVFCTEAACIKARHAVKKLLEGMERE